ncbi:hypothetical protein SAMN05518848_101722 [Paenibacillus sp. PDC88]|nr:hypothetical protein SAMN05518848_101722 [Paenibacillus sp. PDC88]
MTLIYAGKRMGGRLYVRTAGGNWIAIQSLLNVS